MNGNFARPRLNKLKERTIFVLDISCGIGLFTKRLEHLDYMCEDLDRNGSIPIPDLSMYKQFNAMYP